MMPFCLKKRCDVGHVYKLIYGAYKTVIPKSINDLKLIHAGRVLENNKSLADSRITFGDLPVGVITMHVVVQPTTIAKNKTEKSKEDMQKLNSCRCVIL
ncbi:membrane-anchored ubiquitin-fold protein 3 isoform X2 [Gossypium hirsutum]|uniref:Membrane-anchored ubiquitin-fold protein 3 isoform X2 n=1 Tax=Gossypium hirsutum TaxID=3635 RepID=A0A1U8LUN2_GOSHI|nr:membrane-anchored ubiquitin-fold protein 3 isoform X2 [Gossypium hirsutum]